MKGSLHFLLEEKEEALETWEHVKRLDPDDEEVATELSWVVDLAADYTVIYEAFCEDEK